MDEKCIKNCTCQICQPDDDHFLGSYISLRRRNQALTDCIEDLCYQFATWNKGLSTGGLSALEGAFAILGWDDPHVEKSMECDEPGCDKQATCGWPSGEKYRRTCSEHMK